MDGKNDAESNLIFWYSDQQSNYRVYHQCYLKIVTCTDGQI